MKEKIKNRFVNLSNSLGPITNQEDVLLKILNFIENPSSDSWLMIYNLIIEPPYTRIEDVVRKNWPTNIAPYRTGVSIPDVFTLMKGVQSI
jgi:hypothetical protein